MKPNGNCLKPGRFFQKLLVALFGVTMSTGLLMVFDSPSKAAESNANSEYNFSWLDTDKKIYVLQNRRYTKAGHVLVSGMVGVGMSNPYRNVLGIDPRFAYYWSESFGIELFYSVFSNSENSTAKALAITSTGSPVTRELRSQLGGLLHWSPWYAKINVFNQILYFDWYFTAGLGQLSINTQVKPSPAFIENPIAVFLGTGHQYHVSQNWIVRLDLTSSFFSGKILGATGDSAIFSNFNFVAGLGYRL